jgi:acetoin utilization deacetylase AcuC-like enzyme
MRVALVTHPSALEHDTGFGHPERAARIPAVLTGVRSSRLDVVDVEAPEADLGTIGLVHEGSYIEEIRGFCLGGGGTLDVDTVAGRGSWEAALRAAGAGGAAVETLRRGDADVGFVAMRPPGHHALARRAMGFCIFNNIAITARDLARQGERVAIVDWDVHHGNGTQETFLRDPSVLYLSLHEFPAYPGTGWVEEVGEEPAKGTTINFAWPPGCDGGPYRWAFVNVVIPILEQFRPDWILVSSGYDGHRNDPLASIKLDEDDYAFMAGALRGRAPDARTILFLEGGYDLAALTRATAATLDGFAEPPHLESPAPGNGAGWDMARTVAWALVPFWDLKDLPR